MTSHQGTFTRFTGQLICPDGDPTHARISATVDMGSVYTEIPLLTKHLKQSDFFDVAKYPTASFESTKIQRNSTTDSTHIITGNLALHGITQTISFPADFHVDGKELTLSARMTLRQSDFKMQSARTTTDEVPVTIAAQVRQP